MKLSILDQTPISEGETPKDAFLHTIDLAVKAEKWGYHRFWVSEHHHSPKVVGSAPEVLISYILANTSKIRVGSGGVMLQHYSPYKVAEVFHVLEALAPGRVDLGIGSAPGGLPLSTEALQQGNSGKTLEEKLLELRQFLHGTVTAEHNLYGLKAIPEPENPLDFYLLGTSLKSAKIASEFGSPYVFAQFINSDSDEIEAAIRQYRSAFKFRSAEKSAYVILAVSVIVASTDAEARELKSKEQHVKITFEDGTKINVDDIQKAEEFVRQSEKLAKIEVKEKTVIAGSPSTVYEALDELKKKYQVDEFIIVTKIQDRKKRQRSYELLADEVKSKSKSTV
ncbi:LLM class flavin-dependent oxidoreductase [Bacillus gobiensis]|uniref:LLM class flavin-dependent oxidoreductase n=1 Tax=Bacillus gobiensis TaxID=1441095 RepID=UPI003D258FA7